MKITTKTFTTDPYQYHAYCGDVLVYSGDEHQSRHDVRKGGEERAKELCCKNCGLAIYYVDGPIEVCGTFRCEHKW